MEGGGGSHPHYLPLQAVCSIRESTEYADAGLRHQNNNVSFTPSPFSVFLYSHAQFHGGHGHYSLGLTTYTCRR